MSQSHVPNALEPLASKLAAGHMYTNQLRLQTYNEHDMQKAHTKNKLDIMPLLMHRVSG
jgi:hypothetical protein